MDAKTVTYSATLKSGIHDMGLEELYDLAVRRYPAGSRRQVLWQGFLELYRHFLLNCGLVGLDIWVDGSFLTSKTEPNNINMVLWITEEHLDACTDDQFEELRQLRDLQVILKKYGVHLFLTNAGDAFDAALLQGWFGNGYGPYESKGFARITL